MSREAGAAPRIAVDPTVAGVLHAEADERRGAADVLEISAFALDVDGGLRGKRSVGAAGPGPCLTKLHEIEGLALARRVLGSSAVFPTRASFLYYEAGSYGLLHHDISQCTVTLLLALTQAEPLRIYPSFGKPRQDDLEVLNAAPYGAAAEFEGWCAAELGPGRMAATTIPILTDSFVALDGREMAHARYPQDELVMVASLCYAALSYRPTWKL